MRLVNIFGFGFGGLALVASATVGTALWYVQNHDLAPLVRWAAQRQNLPLSITGPVRLRLSGGPEVQLAGLTINAYQGTAPLLTVGRAKVKLAWGDGLAFWKNMHLLEAGAESPTLTLSKDAKGVANWQAPTSVASADEPTAEPTNPEGLNTLLAMLTEARLDIRNLNLTYTDATTHRAVAVKSTDIQATTDGTKAATHIKGTVNASPLEGNLNVDIANLQSIPLTFSLQTAGLTAAATGTVNKQSHFAGKVDVQTENLKQTLTTVLGQAPAQAPAEPFRIVGDVAAGTDQIALKNFTTHMGDLLQASGDATATLTGTPSANGTLHLQSSNLRQLVELVQGRANPSIPAQPITVDATLSGQNTIELKDTRIQLGTVATLTAQATVTPGKNPAQPAVKAQLALSVPNLQTLGKAVGQNALPAQPLDANLTLSGQNGTYTLSDAKATLDSLLTITANATITPAGSNGPAVNGVFALQGANIKTTAAGFGVAAANLPASPFKIGAKVSGQGTLQLDDVVFNLPQLVEATAKLSLTPGKPLNLNGSVDVQRLNATALGYCKAPAAANTAAPTEAAPAAATSAAPWSDTPLNLNALQSVALNLDIQAKGISCANVPVQTAKVKVINTPSQLDVKDLALTFPQGGTVGGSLKLEHAGTPVLAVSLKTANLAVEELVATLKAKGVKLPLNTMANLNSRGQTTRQLAQNLGGTLTLNATQGQLPYTSLLGNVVTLQKALTTGLSSATLPSNGEGKVDSLQAAYTFKNGVMQTENLTVATGNGAMTLKGTGEANLPAWTINMTLTPTLHGANDMAIPVLIKGPLTAPAIGADPAFLNKLTSRLATQVIGKTIGKSLGLDKAGQKGIGAAVGNLVSGQGITSDTVNTLINGFFNK